MNYKQFIIDNIFRYSVSLLIYNNWLFNKNICTCFSIKKNCLLHIIIYYIYCLFIIDGTVSEWKRILDVNVIALSVCSREAVRSMNSRNLEDAHIIHLSR